MTFADVSAADEDTIGTLGKCIYHQVGMHHPGAHNPDDTDVGGILNPGYAGQIGTRVGAPVAAERQYYRLKGCFRLCFYR